MRGFQILKHFLDKMQHKWLSNGSPSHVVYEGLLRDTSATFLICFTYKIGIYNVLFSELMDVIIVIKVAHKKGWHYLWV